MKKPASRKQKLCMECQKCCRNIAVYTHPDFYDCSAKEVADFYEMRGAGVREENGALLLSFPFPCPHLTPDGCAIYEKRPRHCREYDGIEDFGDGCLWAGLKKEK
ncbi:MAG: YkgJ family cysteine cluster protein [Candidatus Sulfobium sp.]|jgi:Fe-S-cluster containining protein